MKDIVAVAIAFLFVALAFLLVLQVQEITEEQGAKEWEQLIK